MTESHDPALAARRRQAVRALLDQQGEGPPGVPGLAPMGIVCTLPERGPSAEQLREIHERRLAVHRALPWYRRIFRRRPVLDKVDDRTTVEFFSRQPTLFGWMKVMTEPGHVEVLQMYAADGNAMIAPGRDLADLGDRFWDFGQPTRLSPARLVVRTMPDVGKTSLVNLVLFGLPIAVIDQYIG